jgi:hypothetical protein
VVSFIPQPLHSQEKSTYPGDRRLVRTLSQSGDGGKEKTSLHCPFKEPNPGCPAHCLFTILTELPQLQKHFIYSDITTVTK